jgi:hypothetical protein
MNDRNSNTKYDNSNRGSIWQNQKKTTDNHPDFTGSLNVDGVDYWVSAWKRKADASPNAPALSFSIKPKDLEASRPALVAAGVVDDFSDDSIPF